MIRLCQICRVRFTNGLMCAPCERSYDRTAFRDGSTAEALRWAAERARRFERRRQRRLADLERKARAARKTREGSPKGAS